MISGCEATGKNLSDDIGNINIVSEAMSAATIRNGNVILIARNQNETQDKICQPNSRG